MAKSTPTMETCTLARSIGVIGDWWTLLILRNALLAGHRRFDEFHRHLGIATNILTRRLSALVEAGILERVPSEHPRSRYEYQVTEKGLELWPVLSALLDWGNRWTSDTQAPTRRLVHDQCGGAIHTVTHCSECDGPLDPQDIYLEPLEQASQVASGRAGKGRAAKNGSTARSRTTRSRQRAAS